MSAYANATDVAAVDRARIIGAGKNPTASDVELYCVLVAAEVDAVLRSKGYSTPIPTTAESDYALLRKINIEGAVAMLEKASPSKPNDKESLATYRASLKMLEESKDVLETPQDMGQSQPRGPGVSIPKPSIDEEGTAPFFTRDMEF